MSKQISKVNKRNAILDTYALPASIKRSAITAFWQVNSPRSGILWRKENLHIGSLNNLSTENEI